MFDLGITDVFPIRSLEVRDPAGSFTPGWIVTFACYCTVWCDSYHLPTYANGYRCDEHRHVQLSPYPVSPT